MARSAEEITEADKARFNLKRNGVRYKLDDSGQLTFIMSEGLENKLKKEYSFSMDMLKVGGDIPLPDLAVHCDEQASTQCHIGMMAEIVRYQLKQKQDEYDRWYNAIFYKTKNFMQKNNEKNITDKGVESRLKFKNQKKLRCFQSAINELEMQYRILDNVIKASVITKGILLPTIRNIVQGKSDVGIGSIKPKSASKIRKKLKLEKEE